MRCSRSARSASRAALATRMSRARLVKTRNLSILGLAATALLAFGSPALAESPDEKMAMPNVSIEGERQTPDIFFVFPTGKGGNVSAQRLKDYGPDILSPLVKPWFERDAMVNPTVAHVTSEDKIDLAEALKEAPPKREEASGLVEQGRAGAPLGAAPSMPSLPSTGEPTIPAAALSLPRSSEPSIPPAARALPPSEPMIPPAARSLPSAPLPSGSLAYPPPSEPMIPPAARSLPSAPPPSSSSTLAFPPSAGSGSMPAPPPSRPSSTTESPDDGYVPPAS